MRITHDKKFNLMYIYLTENEITSTQRVTDDLVIDFDADGKVVGIELLDTSNVDVPAQCEIEDITPERYKDKTPKS
jgi:uncharacterized protein YuzE